MADHWGRTKTQEKSHATTKTILQIQKFQSESSPELKIDIFVALKHLIRQLVSFIFRNLQNLRFLTKAVSWECIIKTLLFKIKTKFKVSAL